MSPARRAVPIVAIVAVQLTLVLLMLNGAATAQAPTPPPGHEVEVINPSERPVPVVAQGNFDVSGDVTVVNDATQPVPVDLGDTPTIGAEQRGEWNVNVTGADIDARPAPATRFFNDRYEFGALAFKDVVMPAPINASLIAISPENDDATVTFFFGAFNAQGVRLSLGALDQQFPAVTTIPLFQPIRIDRFILGCRNLAEDCEIEISIVGD